MRRKGEVGRYIGLALGLKVRIAPCPHPTIINTAGSIYLSISSSHLTFILKIETAFYAETSEHFNI
jgi:hypothetical protein